jgi:glucose-6-phosphate isomerase
MPEKIKIDYSYTFPFINEDDINSIEKKVQEKLKALLNKKGLGNDYLGWIDLPNKVLSSDYINEIIEVGNEIYSKADLIICIGIGGSYLGAKAIINALIHPLHNCQNNDDRNGPKILFTGHNINGKWLEAIITEIEKADSVYVNVISKSGTTTEPGIAFRLIKQFIEKKYGKVEASKRIIATTDKKKGALRSLSENEKYRTFTIPDSIGGRYSVLSPVGLVPISALGIDITKLLKGALEASIFGKNNNIFKNPATFYALLRNLLLKKKYTTEILVNYDSSLHYFCEWWKQLYGESEGKDGKGIFPASVDFTTDLHSMGQWIQEGQRFIFETVLNIEKPNSTLKVPSDKESLDKLEYLADNTYFEINKKAFQGTLLAHHEGKVPNIVFKIPELTPFYLGQLIYIFEEACGISGYLLGVNPFNQPGVEAYKKNMFALLNKPGEEFNKIKESLNEKIKKIPKGKITS